MIRIKGEYEIEILMQNMFNSYSLTMQDHNVVTDNGINYIMECLTTNKTIGDVCTGTSTVQVDLTNTIDDFNIHSRLTENTKKTIDHNTLTYDIQTDGKNLDGTNEIGILTEDGTILVTRDVHDTYNIPHGSVINIKYKITLTNNLL